MGKHHCPQMGAVPSILGNCILSEQDWKKPVFLVLANKPDRCDWRFSFASSECLKMPGSHFNRILGGQGDKQDIMNRVL